jgi:hypothetical protein
MMVKVFEEVLASDREKYLFQLIDQLTAICAERDKLQTELESQEASAESQTSRISQQNDELRNEVEILEKELKQLQWKRSLNQKSYHQRLQFKQEQTKLMKALIITAQKTGHELSQSVRDLKSTALALKSGQIRLLQQSKRVIHKEISQFIHNSVSGINKQENRLLDEAASTLSEVRKEEQKLAEEATRMLETIREFCGRDLDVGVDEFMSRQSEIRDFIKLGIERRQHKAVERVKEEIARQLPGIRFGDESLSVAVDRHINERIKAKELECRDILKKGEARERKLKEQLDKAMRKIQRLQSSGDDYRYLDDFERSRKMWEERQAKLDATMKALNLGSPRH